MKKANFYLYFLLFVLITLNLVLVYQNISLKKNLSLLNENPKRQYGRSYIRENYISDLILCNLSREQVNLKEIINEHQPKLTLLVFFSPTDCATCLSERAIWQRLAEEKTVKVLCIATHPDLNELKTWLESIDFKLPVLLDTTQSTIKKLGIETTPLKVLVTPTGKVIWTDRARLTPEEQKSFWRDFEKALAMSN